MSQQADSAELAKRVLEELKRKPGQKASDLATALSAVRKDINSLLYGKLNGQCVQDARYRWRLSEDAAKQEQAARGGEQFPDTPLSRLCRYYLACLGHEDERGVSVFAKNNHGDTDYAELSSLPLATDGSVFHTEAAQRLIGKIRKDRSRMTMYLGYPVALKKLKSKRSSWEGFMVEPIVLYPVEFEDGATPQIASGFPLINLAVLKRFTNAQSDAVMNELAQLEEELGLTAEDDLPEIDELCQRLAAIRPEWPWEEQPDPEALTSNPPLSEIETEGIFNRPVLVVAQRSPFTQGLETELKSLAQIPEDQYASTALGQWVKGQLASPTAAPDRTLIEVLPLNLEQRQAIDHALSNPLTIITGPPGTGKSQVVADLLITAAWHGKRALFASKNNKAVDVVEIRLNNLGPRPVVLRVGANQYQARLAEYLMSLMAARAEPDDQQEFDDAMHRHKALEQRIAEVAKEETEFVELRNRADKLEQDAEAARSVFGPARFAALRKLDPSRVKGALSTWNTAYVASIRPRQPFFTRLFWSLQKAKRYERLSASNDAADWLWGALALSPPHETPSDETISKWSGFAEQLKSRIQLAEKVRAYFRTLQAMQKARSLEEIGVARAKLVSDMARNAERLWSTWLKLQPTRISQEDRQLLARYNAVLKMVIDAGADGNLDRNVRKQYYELFPKVAHLLPCWAVTSLSARGRIPFAPGFFDLVVFDEASQCDIASALPLLYRAKHAVVIGDPKQLSHISGLRKNQDQQLLGKFSLIEEFPHWAYSYNSLFDLACAFAPADGVIALRDHHRSHADIIQFSNEYFYEGSLRVATAYDQLRRPDPKSPGVRWVTVEGAVHRPAGGGAVNQTEARAVVAELKALLVDRGYVGTVGVVSPFRAQANAIEELASRDPQLVQKLQRAEFLSETVHRFQGDERDVMIFSPVVSKDVLPGALLFLRNNGNLFNVAITRARAMLIVVGDRAAAARSGVEYLAEFSKYVSEIESARGVEEASATETYGPEYPVVSNPEQVSDWERFLYKALFDAGVQTLPQYSIEKYRLDLALIQGDRRLDIEVDGERYHRNWTGELCRRDQIRNQRMFELGWDVLRFWVYEVRDDLGGCIGRVKAWAEKKGGA